MKQVGDYMFKEIMEANSFWSLHLAVKGRDSYTVKQVTLQNYRENPQLEDLILNEIECQKSIVQIQYPTKIQRFINTLKSNNNIYLIYENAFKTTVGQVSIERALKYLNQAVEAINIYHQLGYIHGDIHHKSVYMTGEGIVITRGCFYRQDSNSQYVRVSEEKNPEISSYLPPEIIKRGRITKAVDFYQLGVLSYLWIEGQFPFIGESLLEKDHLQLRFSDGVPVKTQQIIIGMLQPDPVSRWTYRELQKALNNTDVQEQDRSQLQERLRSSKISKEAIRLDLNGTQNGSGAQISQHGLTRIKYMFLLNVSCALLDMSLSDDCLICSLITTRLSKAYNFNLLLQLKNHNQNEEMKKLEVIVAEELKCVTLCFLQQLQGISLETKRSYDLLWQFHESDSIVMSDTEKQSLMRYCRALRQNLDQIIDLNRRRSIMTHLNNVLDCVKMEEFFDTYFTERELQLFDQPYFLMIKGLTDLELMRLIEYKLSSLAWL